ncbi:tetratricopeptide repeat protein [Flavobacterium amniphilum]|uniref:tetratricopeptide repeat protein n=1 Tax=Flavobacterium amniphilum TaxID=1834035 RepID=UPI00202AA927|nr:tetratricopeptide repeat protein [Flavobacterium amniphilum]MCL9806700.1 tetratricopeptide repeat protein [Flavobacterium amniphilum]
MNKVKFFSVAFLALGYTAFAQDVESAKKAIDAEQYEKAKSILKGIVKNTPDNGKAAFLLGNVYLKQSVQDSAKMVFQKGITAKDGGVFNYIGLGQIDLDNGNAQGAQFNFDQATAGMKKKDIEQFVYIGQAYTNSSKPNYKKAIEVLNKAKAVNLNDAATLLALGDAFAADNNNNEAYASYRNSFDANNAFVRAKMQQGVLLKKSKAFNEAKNALEEIAKTNPSYGPVYRELAETYFGWSTFDKANSVAFKKKALENYEKYMSLTDYSVSSKLRQLDFLYVTKEFDALEKETAELKKSANPDPKVYLFSGYVAYEKGKYQEAIADLEKYISNPAAKAFPRPFMYLGFAQQKLAIKPGAKETDKPVVDQTLFATSLENFKKASTLDKYQIGELSDNGKALFEKKLYAETAAVIEVALLNPDSKNKLYDNFFLGYSLYFNNVEKSPKDMNVVELQKADKAFENVATASPTTQDAHLYRARVNSLLTEPTAKEQMAKSYEEFTKVVTTKGPETIEKNKGKMIEAYNELARYFGKADKVKAMDFVSKALLLDPADADALTLQKALK